MKGLLFTYAITYGGAIAALFNPYYGFLAYVCFGVLRPTAMWWYSVPQGNYSRTIAIALIVGWFISGQGSWQLGKARGPLTALGLFWLVCLVNSLTASRFEVAWPMFDTLTKVLLPLAMGITLLDTQAKLRQLIWVVVLSQGLIAYEMNMTYLGGFNRFYFDGFASLDNNGIAITMVTGAAVAFFLAVHEQKLSYKAVAGFAFLLMTHAIMISFSRGGLLALVCCGAVAFCILPKRPIYILSLLCAVLIGYQMAGTEVLERFGTVFASETERDASADSRMKLWRACFELMLQNPVSGVGFDHWRLLAHEHGFERGKAAHSTWMQAGAELGVIGLGSILGFYGLVLWRLLPILKDPPNDEPVSELTAAARMSFCGIVAFLVAAQFVSVVLVEIPYYVAAIGLGALKLASVQEAEAADIEWTSELGPSQLAQA